MKYFLSKLPNKLRVLTVPIASLESATVIVWAKTGSKYEDEKLSGISHFLEHMAFKGGKKYKNAKNVAEAVDAMGGEFNAGTSKEWTNFYIRCGVDNLDRAFDVLSDMLLAPKLRESDIQREKGVIVEEIGMYEDTPSAKIEDYFENLIFKGNTLGQDVIGTRETVRSFKRADFVKYRDKHYFAENMLITVAGGIDEKEVKLLSEKYFGEIPGQARNDDGGARNDGKGPGYKSIQTQPQVFLSNQKREQANFIVGFPGLTLDSPDRYKETVLMTLLGNGMSSRLFTEVREKRGLAYAVRSDSSRYVETGYVGAYGGVDTKRATEAVKVTLNEFYKLTSAKHGITRVEFEKAKEYIKGHIALSLESTKAICGYFGIDELLRGKITTPEEDFEAIDSVTIDDVLTIAKELFNPQMVNLAVIGPYKESREFEKILK